MGGALRQDGSGLSSFPNDIKSVPPSASSSLCSGLSSFPNDIKFFIEPHDIRSRSGLSSFPNDIKYGHFARRPEEGSGLSSFPNDIKFLTGTRDDSMSSGLSSFPNDIKYEHVKPLIFNDFFDVYSQKFSYFSKTVLAVLAVLPSTHFFGCGRSGFS